jgi:hypothetical protein
MENFSDFANMSRCCESLFIYLFWHLDRDGGIGMLIARTKKSAWCEFSGCTFQVIRWFKKKEVKPGFA